jgi:flagellar basal-body rod protein FlgB
MTDPITSDRTLRAAQFALDGLALKQDVISNNLANIDTPGYLAQDADFQSALQRAMKPSESGMQRVSMQLTHPGHMLPQERMDSVQISYRQGGSLRADGNGVDIDVEMSQMAETGIQYQAISQLVSKKLLLLKNIVTGR